MQKPSTPSEMGNANRSGEILVISILALMDVIISIFLSCLTRIWLVKSVDWDDGYIVFAAVGAVLSEKSDEIQDSLPPGHSLGT